MSGDDLVALAGRALAGESGERGELLSAQEDRQAVNTALTRGRSNTEAFIMNGWRLADLPQAAAPHPNWPGSTIRTASVPVNPGGQCPACTDHICNAAWVTIEESY